MLSFLFPPICPLCAKELLDKGEHICKSCSKKQIFIKEPTCYSCGKPMKNHEKEYCSDCRQHPKNFERGMGLCIYQKPVTNSLAAIKYKNERKFAKYYLEEIQKRKYRDLLQLKIDVIIPVPIHRKKRRKRGFNQAEIFANGIAEMLNRIYRRSGNSSFETTRNQRGLCILYSNRKRIFLIFPSWYFVERSVIMRSG